jgi:hypothetical protein
MVAVQGDNADMIMVLVKTGADAKAKDNTGFSGPRLCEA